jgi:hypothetical protein
MEFNSAVKWLKSAQFQAPAAMQMSSAFFCDVTQPAEVIPYRRFETPYRYRLQVPSNVRRIKFQCWSTPNQPSGSLVPPQHHVLSAHQRTAILHYFAAQTPDLAQLPVLYQQPQLHLTQTGSLFTCLVTSVGTDTRVTVGL